MKDKDHPWNAVKDFRWSVPDAGSASGYKLDPGPFRGWKEIPTW